MLLEPGSLSQTSEPSLCLRGLWENLEGVSATEPEALHPTLPRAKTQVRPSHSTGGQLSPKLDSENRPH